LVWFVASVVIWSICAFSAGLLPMFAPLAVCPRMPFWSVERFDLIAESFACAPPPLSRPIVPELIAGL
jgi:hypothetical protein